MIFESKVKYTPICGSEFRPVSEYMKIKLIYTGMGYFSKINYEVKNRERQELR